MLDPEGNYEAKGRPSIAATSYRILGIQHTNNGSKNKTVWVVNNLPAATLETPMTSQELLSKCCIRSLQA